MQAVLEQTGATGAWWPAPAAAPPAGASLCAEAPPEWRSGEAARGDAAPRGRLMDRIREAMRLRHLSPRTERAYLHRMRRYFAFHRGRHPATLGAPEVTAFLSWLATERSVAASTQNQALAALLFLYREVLGTDLPWLDDVVRARRPARLPVVLARDEVRELLRRLDGTPRLMATLLYGSGLRLLECCRPRVKDVDLQRHQFVVRQGKGDRDRLTMLPAAAEGTLREHLARIREQHARDVSAGGRAAGCAGAQAPECGPRVGLAVGVRSPVDRILGP
jgi:integrase